jgi:tetratricopeptide (TPR) repeat protein
VDKALFGYRADLHFDPARLRTRLSATVAGAPQETLRIWSLGWLAWLTGEYDKAELLLEQALQLARAANDLDLLARAGYWLARVQMLREKPDPIAGFETLLRALKGSPQGTVWFVDLLIRAGRMDRAEQVWKSVKANKKVSGANEAALIEARLMLKRGENANAEKTLQEMPETNGVLEAEKKLLLAWMAASKKQDATALQLWEEASQRLYPRPALDAWRDLLARREKGDATLPETGTPASLRALFRASQARIDGDNERAVSGYREALQLAVNAPWARYGLALLGADDFNEVQTLATNVFLATRCRLWIALQKFSQRQISPEDWLSTVQQQLGQGMRTNPTLEHFRLLGLALRQSRPPVETLQQLLEQATARQGAQRRNFLRAFLELCDKAAPQVVKEVLPEEPLGELWDDPRLRQELSRLRLRAALAGGGEPWTLARLTERINGLPESEALVPVRQLLSTLGGTALTDAQRATLTALEANPRCQGTVRVLLTHDAIKRGEVSEVVKQLERLDTWAGLRFVPHSLAAALAKFVAARSTLPVWKACLPPWLGKVAGQLGDTEDVKTLKTVAGLLAAPTGPQPPPAGVDPTAWHLFQAARLSARGDAVDAWKAASSVGENLSTLPEEQQGTVKAALPTLERLALASAILRMIPAAPNAQQTPAALLDLVAQLGELPEGKAVLTVCQNDNRKELRPSLQALLEVKNLPDRLAHHLAIWTYRIATGLEEHSPNDTIDPWWKLSWQAWLRHLIKWSPEERAPLIDHLLKRHRQTLTDRLARAQMEPARKVWSVVTDLPSLAEKVSPPMKAELTARVNAFRDDLASEYLVQTRDAMRTGTIREGFSADYDKGLSYLRRLLSLDRENVRLLTALVEICHEWFLDFYNAGDPPGLAEQLERFTPFALQLARLVEGKPEEHAPRAALSDFWKFRGFMSRDLAEKRRLFEQALEFNPANENARSLLDRLNQPNQQTPATNESTSTETDEDEDLDEDDLDDDDDLDEENES